MNTPGDDRAPVAKAMDWASKITSTSIMMVLPLLLGYWADQKLGTVILFTFVGLIFGMACAIWQLKKLVSVNQHHEDEADSNNEETKEQS